jgi:hypothetical protein
MGISWNSARSKAGAAKIQKKKKAGKKSLMVSPGMIFKKILSPTDFNCGIVEKQSESQKKI